MPEKPLQFRVVYRGITDAVARRLETDNVFTKADTTEATLRFWNACDPLETRPDAWFNIMAISLPEDARGLYDAKRDVVVLPRNMTLKCIGVGEFKKILTPGGVKRQIRMFAMEVLP